MELFSQKYGHKPVKTVIQVHGIDEDLRNGLWNVVDTIYLWRVERTSHSVEGISELFSFGVKLWSDYLKKPLDTMPNGTLAFKQEVREYFFQCEFLYFQL